MGEAVDTVKGNGHSSSRVPRSKTFAQGSVLADLTNVLDRIDRAKEVKQDDLDQEGRSAQAENHAKLGLLQAAGALVRRARALLEDYGGDLDEDISADLVEGLGDDLKRKFTDTADPPLKPLKAKDLEERVFADAEEGDDAPFGPEDLPKWLKLGVELRDPDEDGPWIVEDIDYELGRVMIADARMDSDGNPFKGGTPQDSITFDELAPEGEWCPYACGHTTTSRDGSCADCGVKDVSVPIMPDIGSKWTDDLDETWVVKEVLDEGNQAQIKLKAELRDLTQTIPIRELQEDFTRVPPGPPSPPRPPKNKPVA